jgi:hypothetical protein
MPRSRLGECFRSDHDTDVTRTSPPQSQAIQRMSARRCAQYQNGGDDCYCRLLDVQVHVRFRGVHVHCQLWTSVQSEKPPCLRCVCDPWSDVTVCGLGKQATACGRCVVRTCLTTRDDVEAYASCATVVDYVPSVLTRSPLLLSPRLPVSFALYVSVPHQLNEKVHQTHRYLSTSHHHNTRDHIARPKSAHWLIRHISIINYLYHPLACTHS